MKTNAIPLLLSLVILSGLLLVRCGSAPAGETPAVVPAATDTAHPTAPTATPVPTDTPAPTDTATALPATELPIPTGTPTTPLIGTPISTPGNAIIIDHTAIALFDQIPDEYIRAASQIRFFFRHASVGHNIDDGLNCMMDNFDRRPNFCDRDLSANQIVADPKYDRSNWIFEFHAEPNPNPGWWNKVTYFLDRINDLSPEEQYDWIGFKFGYTDGNEGSNIDEKFFQNDPSDNLPSIEDLEALEAAHPDEGLILWTMALSRLRGTPDTTSFNEQMRAYAIANNGVLIDIADIESHRPDGTPCYDNQGNGYPALCQDYTEEVNGGHLNALGRLRMAKALWVLMARLAGWVPPVTD